VEITFELATRHLKILIYDIDHIENFLNSNKVNNLRIAFFMDLNAILINTIHKIIA